MSIKRNRYLNSPQLRAALYDWADGQCQSCGEELPENWHADHVIPWSVLRRTNVFELQALCPTCNSRKGADLMYGPPQFAIDESKFREGQRRAYNVIVDRFAAGEKYSAIVLTTRYGKTDVARMVTLRLWRDGMTRNGLIIVPSRILVEQSLDNSKVDACLSRYGIPREVKVNTYPMDRPPRRGRLKGALLSSMTMQMAQLHLNILQQWIDSNKHQGFPPVVFMDEAHMESEANTWGEVPGVLAEAGAHVVLMTATPIRADRQPIPGFPYEEVGRETDSRGRVNTYYEVKPHWRTSLQDALAEPNPPVCQVTYQPFGITGTLEDTATGEKTRGNLRELSDDDMRQELRWAVRTENVINKGCQYFLRELQNRRRDPRQKNTTGIIFLDSRDASLDLGDDDQIKTVRKVMASLAHRLNVKVAVSDDPDSAETLDQFARGEIDVLMVKQMASVGLDVDHLKVALDLSNIRSYAALFQRLMRIATRWDDSNYPDQPVLTATYIAPDDPIIERRLEQIRREEGEITIVSEPPPEGGPIDIPPKGPTGGLPPLRGKLFFADDVELSGSLVNFDDTAAPAAFVDPADDFYRDFPGASQTVDKAALANWLQRHGVTPDDEEAPEEYEQERVNNITAELNRWREVAFAEGKRAINRRFRRTTGKTDWRASPEEYRETIVSFWAEHKRRVGANPSTTSLSDIDDVEQLKSMVENIREELAK